MLLEDSRTPPPSRGRARDSTPAQAVRRQIPDLDARITAGAVQLEDSDRGRGPRRRPDASSRATRERGRRRLMAAMPRVGRRRDHAAQRRARGPGRLRPGSVCRATASTSATSPLRPRQGQGLRGHAVQHEGSPHPDPRAALAVDDRETVEDVRGVDHQSRRRPSDPLWALSPTSRLGEGPSEVRRIDGRRVAVVTANIAEGSLSHGDLERSSDGCIPRDRLAVRDDLPHQRVRTRSGSAARESVDRPGAVASSWST